MMEKMDIPKKKIDEEQEVEIEGSPEQKLIAGIPFVKATGTRENYGNIPSEKIVGRNKNKKFFSLNNGIVGLVDEGGVYWITWDKQPDWRQTKSDIVMSLEKAGYAMNNGVNVPHSNDGGEWLRKNLPENGAVSLEDYLRRV